MRSMQLLLVSLANRKILGLALFSTRFQITGARTMTE